MYHLNSQSEYFDGGGGLLNITIRVTKLVKY